MAKARKQPSPPLQAAQVWCLLATALLGLAPFIPTLPVLMQIAVPVLLAARAWGNWRNKAVPSRLIMGLAAVLGVAFVLNTYHTVVGKEAGLALLTWLLPLKLLEANTRRDARVAIMLCCFMLTGQFLNEQSPLVAVFVLVCAGFIIMTSAKLEQPMLSVRTAARQTRSLLLGAVPLMVLLFVLFPRIDGPLWGMPLDSLSSSTGLSDDMEPGSIANLIVSGEVAFRVEFEGTPPTPQLRYWRGPVLTDFDGRTWHQRHNPMRPEPHYSVDGPAYTYWMTLEPHRHNWLLALDYPAPKAENAQYGEDLNLLTRNPVQARIRYRLTSYPQTKVGLDELKFIRAAALRLPQGSNPRTVALGQKLHEENANPAERVQAAIRFMRGDGLAYTLSPPIAGQHAADEFLFDNKKGFCEHFSSAFTILMRAAGVPARVVTGYQGGEFNPLDGTLVVRQSEAHAWSEVWLEGQGWVRVDPTALSAPRRIADGLANALGDTQMPLMLRQDNAFVRNLRYRMEALSNTWNQWVLGYNAKRQTELLNQLGVQNADWRTLTSLLGSFVALWLAWLTWRLWPRGPRGDALDRSWRLFCRRLARRGVRREPWEGPADFARRAALAMPAQAATILALAEEFARLRYGLPGSESAAGLAAFRRAVQQFRP